MGKKLGTFWGGVSGFTASIGKWGVSGLKFWDYSISHLGMRTMAMGIPQIIRNVIRKKFKAIVGGGGEEYSGFRCNWVISGVTNLGIFTISLRDFRIFGDDDDDDDDGNSAGN